MLLRVVILSISFLAAAAYIEGVSQPEPVPLRQSLSGVSMRVGAWSGRNSAELDQNVVALLGVDDYLSRVYVSDSGAMVGLYVGYYESQRQGSSIHSPLNCLPGAGWNPSERSAVTIPVATSGSGEIRNIEVNRILIEKGSEKRLVFYWYQSQGRVIANEYVGKFYTIVDAIRTNRTDAALVRVITPADGPPNGSRAGAEAAAVDFVQQIFPLLSRYLPE